MSSPKLERQFDRVGAGDDIRFPDLKLTISSPQSVAEYSQTRSTDFAHGEVR